MTKFLTSLMALASVTIASLGSAKADTFADAAAQFNSEREAAQAAKSPAERLPDVIDDHVPQSAEDPTADLSDMDRSEIAEKAEADAVTYFAAHHHLSTSNTSSIGLAHAIHHHLRGDMAGTYATYFFSTLDALIEDKD